MKKLYFIISILIFTLSIKINAQKVYKYDTIPNDPLKARIYKLDNGLTVYMSVYKDKPRIQTYIATRAGSKNDPADATGLAHYFEHMMFKGSDHFGTLDYDKEKIEISKIDSLFEIYRITRDSLQKTYIYHLIDSISVVASKYAIPNEYDKLSSLIGADGTNAYTSLDQTVFINNIPSNQLENWTTIEADRFNNPVLRLFHTELETVYEEKNKSLDNDNRKVLYAMLESLFPHHTYGTQTTIGTIEHLKNPSMKRIREFYNTYYVPNNMAICLSGDFNPDEAIKLIDQKFGSFKSKTLPIFKFEKESPITTPIIKEVIGPESENVSIAFRFNGARSNDVDYLNIFDMILSNSSAGLIDLNLNQKQLVLKANSYISVFKDYSFEVLNGKPKDGQSLEQVKDLLLSQIELIKKGDFPDWLITAIINNLYYSRIKSLETNSGRNDAFVNSFVNEIEWKDEVNKMERLSKITKKDIVDFANKNFSASNYVVVYKRTGIDKSVPKIKKPNLSVIKINRDSQSEFLKKIKENKIKDIQPVFVDFDKDITKLDIKSNINVYYKENVENNTFNIYYFFDMGGNNDKRLQMAVSYLDFVGTSKLSPAEVKQEFYKIGCKYSLNFSEEQIFVSVSGLTSNLEKALQLTEDLFSDAQPNEQALADLKSNTLKSRKDAKLNKNAVFGAMRYYGMYGANSPFTYRMSETEINAINSADLLNIIKNLFSHEHHILFYGNIKQPDIIKILNKYHNVPSTLKPVPEKIVFKELPTTENKLYHVDFSMKQAEILMLAKGDLYNKEDAPVNNLFNEYFGGSMNSIVFQELRESRALAYTARSTYVAPNTKDKSYWSVSYIGTQADKIGDAMNALLSLHNNMPESEKSFNNAKISVIQQMRTTRYTKSQILIYFENIRKLGLTYDINKDIFDKVQNLTFEDIKNYQIKNLKDKAHTTMIIGDKNILNFDLIKNYGTLNHLTLEDIFGY